MGEERERIYDRLLLRACQGSGGSSLDRGMRQGPAPPQDRTPLTDLMEFILQEALYTGASDVHFEPIEGEVRIRMRRNGQMRAVFRPMPLDLYGNFLSRVKIISGLDIAEKRLPQDGRFSFWQQGSVAADIRVSVVPMINGEKIVLRLLNVAKSFKDMESLDLSSANLSLLQDLCQRGNGAILLAGPVNSGKTTSMYAVLNWLNSEQVNIISLEDPVEYRIFGINQIQINEKIGLTFEKALYAVLRQDFDCLAVGEVRSPEVAKMMITSALTGRRIFGTIHTPGAVRTVHRLLDMGIRPYLLVAALRAVMGQRLVRRLCRHCRESYEVTGESLEAAFLGDAYEEGKLYFRPHLEGCPACGGTGWEGRLALQEILILEGEVAQAIMAGKGVADLAQVAAKHGMVTMKQDGIRKAKKGKTSLEELMKIFAEGE